MVQKARNVQMLHLVHNFDNSVVELAQNLARISSGVTRADATELAQGACSRQSVSTLHISRALQREK